MLFQEIALAALSAASQVANQLTDHYLLERRLKAALGRPAIFHPNSWRNLTAGNGVPIHLFFPQDVAPLGVLLFFHGGGWTTGGTESYARVCRVMAQITAWRRNILSLPGWMIVIPLRNLFTPILPDGASAAMILF